jgi:hypothetical protein
MDTQELTELTPEQKKAFGRLKRAYKDCEKLGVLFVNRYAHLYAYDKKRIKAYGDKTAGFPESETIPVMSASGGDCLKIAPEWCDDDNCHLFHLTPRAMLFLKQQALNDAFEGFV